MTRRSFLAGSGAAVLTACTGRGRAPVDSTPLVVANHPLYIDADTNRSFTAATGTPVVYHEEIADDGAWFASVRPLFERQRSIGRDVVIVRDWVAARLATNGWLAGPSPVTWASTMIGIAYDRRVQEITRVADLFDESLRGRVAFPNDMRTTLGMALLADHFDPSTVTFDQAAATASRLHNSVILGQLLPFEAARSNGPTPIDRLRAGDATASVAAASDTVGLEETNPDIVFVVPEEGGLQFTDVAVVPIGGANPSAAEKYLAFVDDPANAVARFRQIPVLWPPGSIDELLQREPAIVEDPRRNPPPDVRARLRSFRVLDDQEDSAFSNLFTSAIRPDR